MYVDFVIPVESSDVDAYEEDYPFQAIQVKSVSTTTLLRLMKTFERHLKKATKEYEISIIKNAKRLVLPEAVLKKVADYTNEII